MKSEEQSLLNFAQSWDKAMIGNDAREIGKFMIDDWALTGSDGITSKEKFLESISSGHLTHNRMDADEVIIKVYENTGLVIAKGTSAGEYKGNAFSLYEWSTSVFIKKEEEWICVSTMLTPANK